jgi:hypothetical protein
MNKSEWLYAEISTIEKESKCIKYKNISDNKIMIKLLLLLFPLLLFAFNLPAIENSPTSNQICSKDDGVSWKCKGCGKRIWSNRTDWAGRYQCGCGVYKD